jgi:hypothetical protein
MMPRVIKIERAIVMFQALRKMRFPSAGAPVPSDTRLMRLILDSTVARVRLN